MKTKAKEFPGKARGDKINRTSAGFSIFPSSAKALCDSELFHQYAK